MAARDDAGKEMRMIVLASAPSAEPDPAATFHRPSRGYAYERFDRRRQLRRLASASLARWLLTVALTAAIYAVLWAYSARPAMTSDKKREFNGLVIGLSIGLGLNIASSLKAMVSELRWWLLSLDGCSPREADLILQSDHLSRLMQLGCTSRRFKVRLFVVVWLLVNLASQVSLATLGLSYNINGSQIAVTAPGAVSIPDMSNIQTTKVVSSPSRSPLSALRYTANSYGLVALAFGVGYASEIPRPGALYNPDNNVTFCGSNSCRYVFFESSPSNASYYATVATDRYVSTSSSCQSWRVTSGGDGMRPTIVLADANRTEIGPLPALNGPGQTLFMHDPEQPSGDTWSVVTALEASADPWFYRCNVSIGPVVRAVVREHLVGVNVSRLAAPAIALQGYGASSTTGVDSSTDQIQFQSYPAESWFGRPHRGDVAAMGLTLAQFSCGVLGVVALSNSNILAPGLVPLKGVMLEIARWDYVHLILGLTVGLQLLLAVASVATANRVQVRGRSHLSMASLLRPVLREVGWRAGAANGKQMASMLGPHTKLSYAPDRGGGGGYRVLDH
ncbi:hypothetical protein CDD83_8156 [Cordyceps sp. RAO-2017]|nr:hypothetical protein CDD83_8156 [Cordyceps sp. RAO-2017]